MTSKKAPSSKRAGLPRLADYSKEFQKDWQRLSKSARYDMKLLKHVMLKLIADEGPLEPEWRDHQLKGNWSDHRECHIGGDFLLIYRIVGESVLFVRAGTHSELFSKK
jgi:mRNA interferase YafQ